MNPIVKIIAELGPLISFFVAYKLSGKDMITATAVFMVAMAVSLAVSWFLTRKLPKASILTAVVVFVFGGLTLWFGQGYFAQIKPTIINAMFSVILAYGLWRKQSYLKVMFAEGLSLSERGWIILTQRWAVFFALMALINEVVWRTQTEDMWVNIKTFGYLPLTFLFTFVQIPLIRRYHSEENS